MEAWDWMWRPQDVEMPSPLIQLEIAQGVRHEKGVELIHPAHHSGAHYKLCPRLITMEPLGFDNDCRWADATRGPPEWYAA